MSTTSSEFLRIDPLTECRNFLGFLETCLNVPQSDSPRDDFTMKIPVIEQSQFSAILFVDINGLTMLNKTKGRVYSDSILHWMGILLREESNGIVFRLGADEFAVLLRMDTKEGYSRYLERILERMIREARLLGFPESPADVVLILYDQSPTTLDTVCLGMGEAMTRVKSDNESHVMIFNASEFNVTAHVPTGWKSDIFATMRWLSYKAIHQVLELDRNLEQTQQEAYTDAISGLPNMKAALRDMEKALENSKANQKPCSILMIDGDNIRLYNNINYAAGDEMIRDMSVVLKNNLRPSDLVARWRTGDEFIVILPDTPIEDAKIVGERFRLAIKEASKNWLFPTTISIGAASYPLHGDNINALIDKAESANKHAKDQGKDQIVLAD
jgi:diguanylate cyclase (GGDEF)-like protein